MKDDFVDGPTVGIEEAAVGERADGREAVGTGDRPKTGPNRRFGGGADAPDDGDAAAARRRQQGEGRRRPACR
jgi:hypothetical protein